MAAVAAALGAQTFTIAGAPNIDDAFILLVYVRHFERAGSIYWNAEEGHVDGCTSMLDMVLKAGLHRLFGGELFRFNWIVTLVLFFSSILLGVWLTARLERDYAPRTRWHSIAVAGVGSLALATNLSTADGCKMLLETPLFVFVLLTVLLLQLRPARPSRRTLVGLGIAWICLVIARPEGLALLGWMGAFFVWKEHARLSRKELVTPLAIAIVGLALYFAWHTSYFGYWAPNTYYAKKSDSRLNEIIDGYGYVRSYWEIGAWPKLAIGCVLSSPLLALLPVWRHRAAHRAFVFVTGAALLNLATVIYAGGDLYWGFGRFLSCCTTLATIGLLLAGFGARGWARALAAGVLLALVCAGLYAGVENSKRWSPSWGWRRASNFEYLMDAATALRSIGARRVAQTDAQGLKFFDDDLMLIDASALNDSRAAHLPAPGHVLIGKGGIPYAIERDSEAIVYGSYPFTADPMGGLDSVEVLRDDRTSRRTMGVMIDANSRFRLADRYRAVSAMNTGGGYFNFWLRQDLVTRLEGRKDLIVSQPMRAIPFEGPSVRVDDLPAPKDGEVCAVIAATTEGVHVNVTFDGAPLVQLEPETTRWAVDPKALTAGPHTIGLDGPVTALGFACQQGSVFGNHLLAEPISSKYRSLGAEKSYLGAPISGTRRSVAWCTEGRYVEFEHGWIDVCPTIGVWAHGEPDDPYPGARPLSSFTDTGR